MHNLSNETLDFLRTRLQRRAEHHKVDLMRAMHHPADGPVTIFTYNAIGGFMSVSAGERPAFHENIRDLRAQVAATKAAKVTERG